MESKLLCAGVPVSLHSYCEQDTSLQARILTCGERLCYPCLWRPSVELRLPQTDGLLGQTGGKIHNLDWSLTNPWLPLRTQSSERISAKSLIRPFSAFAETPATACKSREASSPTP